jgi:hypothetical protein
MNTVFMLEKLGEDVVFQSFPAFSQKIIEMIMVQVVDVVEKSGYRDEPVNGYSVMRVRLLIARYLSGLQLSRLVGYISGFETESRDLDSVESWFDGVWSQIPRMKATEEQDLIDALRLKPYLEKMRQKGEFSIGMLLEQQPSAFLFSLDQVIN